MNPSNNAFSRFLNLTRASVKLFAKHIYVFLPVGLLFMLPVNLFNAAVSDRLTGLINGLYEGRLSEDGALLVFLMFAVFITLYPLLDAAIAGIVHKLRNGEKPTLGSILDSSVNKFFKLSYTNFLYFLLVFIPMLLIFPSLYFMAALGFRNTIVATSDKSGIDALQASRNIVRGQWWSTAYLLFGIEIFALFFTNIVSDIFVAAVPEISKPAELALYTITGLFVAIAAIFRALCYFELSEAKKASES